MSWAEIKKAINGTLGTSKFKPLDEILGGGIEKLKTGTVPIVRHIQRGIVTGNTANAAINVTLSGFANVNKMIVLFDHPFYGQDRFEYVNPVYVSSLTTVNLTIKFDSRTQLSSKTMGYHDYSTLGYQVIEFY